jgi:hypothetical protein
MGMNPAEHQVDDSITEQGIMAAVEYAEKHWQQVARRGLRSEVCDDDLGAGANYLIREPAYRELLRRFRAAFPLLQVDTLVESHFNGDRAMADWAQFNGVNSKLVADCDWSFLTLLRIDNSRGYEPDNVLLVKRIEFMCVELARELDPKLSDAAHEAALVDLLTQLKHELVAALAEGDSEVVCRTLTTLDGLPCPSDEVLIFSRVGLTLTRASRHDCEAVVGAAKGILSRWRAALVLRALVLDPEQTLPSNGDLQSAAQVALGAIRSCTVQSILDAEVADKDGAQPADVVPSAGVSPGTVADECKGKIHRVDPNFAS